MKVTIKRAFKGIAEGRVFIPGETVDMSQERYAELRKALAAAGYKSAELPAKVAEKRPARKKAE